MTAPDHAAGLAAPDHAAGLAALAALEALSTPDAPGPHRRTPRGEGATPAPPPFTSTHRGDPRLPASLRGVLAALDAATSRGTLAPCRAASPRARAAWIADDDTDRANLAATACLACPVLAECRRHATEHPAEAGVLGGTTELERRRARAATRENAA